MKWSKTMKVLITAGGTREPIDRVRAITNTSTGTTGAALAVALTALGHSVELLRSAHSVAPLPSPSIATQTFTDTASLDALLRERLGRSNIDAVLMTAAIADFRPADPPLGKIDSEAEELTLRLVRVPKLLPQLRAMSPRPLRVIGFKLTVSASNAERLDAVDAQFHNARVDAVVHNDLSEIEAAAARSTPHPFRLYTRPDDETPPRLLGPDALAEAIHAFLTQPAK